jgi:hypothetical protein
MIDSVSALLSWTPGEGTAGAEIRVRATDAGGLSAIGTLSVVVQDSLMLFATPRIMTSHAVLGEPMAMRVEYPDTWASVIDEGDGASEPMVSLWSSDGGGYPSVTAVLAEAGEVSAVSSVLGALQGSASATRETSLEASNTTAAAADVGAPPAGADAQGDTSVAVPALPIPASFATMLELPAKSANQGTVSASSDLAADVSAERKVAGEGAAASVGQTAPGSASVQGQPTDAAADAGSRNARKGQGEPGLGSVPSSAAVRAPGLRTGPPGAGLVRPQEVPTQVRGEASVPPHMNGPLAGHRTPAAVAGSGTRAPAGGAPSAANEDGLRSRPLRVDLGGRLADFHLARREAGKAKTCDAAADWRSDFVASLGRSESERHPNDGIRIASGGLLGVSLGDRFGKRRSDAGKPRPRV